METKRSRSRSASPSPVPKKRARIEELRTEQTRLEAQLKDLLAEVAAHPDAIRDRLKHDAVADAVLPNGRLTKLSSDKEGNYWHMRLTLDGASFVFDQKKNNIVGGWYNDDTYERDEDGGLTAYRRKKDGKKQGKNISSRGSWADDIEEAVESFVEFGDPKTTDPRDLVSYAECLADVHESLDMPLLDIEAAFIAFVVFRNESE
jgi:hypothetical protein